jgi:pyrroline-5-carboxylate reductase
MGTALLNGILAAEGDKTVVVKRYYACVRRQESADRVKKCFSQHNEVEVVCGDHIEALRSADTVILGFQPGDTRKILSETEVAQALAEKLIISMVAGVTCDALSSMLGLENSSARIIRVIPSVGAQINQSCSLVSESELADPDMALVQWIVSRVGSITIVPEDLLNTAVAISATSHALATTAVDAITDGSVSRGVSRAVALRLAAECLRSASSLLLESMTLEELKDSMSVPHGITTEAWVHLELGNVRSAITQSVRHAVDYAQSMA